VGTGDGGLRFLEYDNIMKLSTYATRLPSQEPRMPDPRAVQDGPTEPIPLAQRLFDNVYLLLVAGIAVMALLYTGWGMWEILTLPPATLP